MKGRIVFWSIVSALAGFLFGFDTVVISGAEKTIEALWNLSPQLHGVAMGAALYGTTLGALLGGIPTDRWGRRKTLIAIGGLYFISAVWSGLATGVYAFILARFIGGLGVGISTIAAPLYISEIAPPKHRGFLTGLFQFNIVFGIIIAFLSNYLLQGIGENAWRWMLGAEALPALVYWALCFIIPESPRWLILKGYRAQGAAVLRRVSEDLSETQFVELMAEIEASSPHGTAGWRSLFAKAVRGPVLLAFTIAAFNQLSGVNAILYFAPRIFELTGLGAKAAMFQSVGIGVTNLIFTFVGLALIDRLGRKTLLYIGSLGYIASLGLTAYAFASETYAIVPACIFFFIASHAVGQGSVIWVFIAEIFPNATRAAGQSVGCSTHWIFAAAITSFFPLAVRHFEPVYIFGFFCAMMVLQLLWVFLFVPETKGQSLEHMKLV